MIQLLLDSKQWRRRWRALQHKYSAVPWVCLIISLMVQQTTAYHHLHHPHPPPPSPHSPAMLVQQYQNPQAQGQSHSLLTGPSAMPPNYYYTIDSGSKLVQRQMPPGPSGITAAATNYLLQQLEIERQQQHPQHRTLPPPQPPQFGQSNAQALQLLANLTPQQLAALQTVIPTLPRSGPGPQQMMSANSNNPVGAVAVMPPGGMENGHSHPQSSFASRMGPFDKLFNKAKSWLPDMMSSGSSVTGSKSGGNGIGEPKMRDLHRLPKPPQYPLYDLPSIGLATPPPAPIMHPMASLPNSAFDLDQPPIAPPMQSSSPRSTGTERSGGGQASSYNQQNWMSPSPTMSTKRRSHRPTPQRPPKPSRPSFLRNPLGRSHKKSRPSSEPPLNYNRRNHGPPPPSGRQPPPRERSRPRNPSLTTKPKKNGPPKGRYQSSGRRPPSPGPSSDPFGASMGFDHPMASNLSPAQSPALGRPLSYEEYMARPSHSYTDDPWNFDPFASQMNQGLHTHALRYNYDPLGMNALDTEANSHLDPNKLSYPGDSFNQDMVKDSPGIQGTSQIGGWDKPFKKRPYNSDPELELTPPGANPGYGSSSSAFSSSPNDPYQPPSSLGSSNRYKNSGSSSSNSHSTNNAYLGGDALSGGRRGEIPSMDHLEGGSALPSFDEEQGNRDEAPTVDLESLSTQDEDGMSGLEFTIETSMDKGAGAGGGLMEESSQPNPHILGPMQPAPNPFLSDQYSPYGEQSAPVSSSVPGNPYGPGGYRDRERYGRRRTRNNHGQVAVGRRILRTRAQKQRAVVAPSSQPASSVPEGVQIFNEIIRPQLVQSSSKSHPQHAALRRQLYNAIRQSAKK